jgi:predicted component of type VI protein secretion system
MDLYLKAELAASQAMLGEEHPDLLQESDTNTGRIGQRNVVLARLDGRSRRWSTEQPQ